MFLYDFDTFGIIYTAAVAALIVLLIIPTVVFCVRKAPTGGATKAFRALDIVLLVLLVAAWAVYVLARLTVFGLHISASGGDAAFTLDGETLFALPGCATLTDVAASVLGTLLLGVLTFLCVLALVLSFARRHKEAAVVVVSSGSAEMPPVSVTAEEIVPAPAADGPVVRSSVTEEAAESVAEEQVAEPQPEIAGPAPVRAKTEPTAPPRPAAEEGRVVTEYSDRARGTSDKRYSSSLQMPGGRKAPVRPPLTRPQDERAEREARLRGEEGARPLPVTRKLVITNRMNVVNMYNEYLKEKRGQEKGKTFSPETDDKK
ncbi:MAG TPA: hypothetical protein H9892_00110 [Candidatus Protoclostridium stercorigallinarum]|uniref:Uncharacterized protein n=1 Tax=Candidatus Protoclostridium stercorigallinarum TaxID=2838741 RepID=A0A9D1PYQ0_9FIRM|nr:hypothetical protein [Candidatus Protoclostridium stercorigallinarum]